jgi:type VI secretion system protein VasI
LLERYRASAKKPEDCAGIRDDISRLECYDLIFKKDVVAKISSKWMVREEISKIDDTTNVFMGVRSVNPHINRFGNSEYPSLHITCRENNTDLYIVFAGEFMSDHQGGGRVTYRIDKQDAETKDFHQANDSSALGLWDGELAIPFIQDLFGADTLLIRATPFSESAITATFPITGLEGAIIPLREACDW